MSSESGWPSTVPRQLATERCLLGTAASTWRLERSVPTIGSQSFGVSRGRHVAPCPNAPSKQQSCFVAAIGRAWDNLQTRRHHRRFRPSSCQPWRVCVRERDGLGRPLCRIGAEEAHSHHRRFAAFPLRSHVVYRNCTSSGHGIQPTLFLSTGSIPLLPIGTAAFAKFIPIFFLLLHLIVFAALQSWRVVLRQLISIMARNSLPSL
jgi:hypothetical protein